MANVIIINKLQSKMTSRGKGNNAKTTVDNINAGTFVYPLTEDVTFDYQSEIGGMLDGVPGLSKLTDLMSTVNSITATGGRTSKGNIAMEQFMSGPRWKSTNPVKFPVKILLYTQDDAYKDVWLRAKNLISMSILTYDRDSKTYITPGLNINDIKGADPKKKGPERLTGNYISVEIPGMLYLPMAFIEKVTPNFSKEVCWSHEIKKNFPIWCEVELNITGVYPATTEFLDMVTDDSFRPDTTNKTTEESKEKGVA